MRSDLPYSIARDIAVCWFPDWYCLRVKTDRLRTHARSFNALSSARANRQI